MTILNKDGKPVEKKWEEMDTDEKLNVIRIGVGALIQQGNALGAGMSRILKALDQDEAERAAPEVVEPTLAQPKMDEPPFLQPDINDPR